MVDTQDTLCQYRVLDNGVHEFIMLEFSRVGVDAFADAVAAMNATLPPNTPVPLLIDSSGGTQPFNYLINRMRELNETSPKPDKPGRVAFIHQSGVIASMVDGMLRIFSRVQIRIFRPDERDKAMAWLTEAS